MSDVRIGLDNPVFAGRYKQFGRGSYMPTQPRSVAAQMISDIKYDQTFQSEEVAQTEIQPEYVDMSSYEPDVIDRSTVSKSSIASVSNRPPVRRLSQSEVIQRNITARPRSVKYRKPFLNAQRVVLGMAVVVFLAGLGVAFNGFRNNRNVEAQVQSAVGNNEITKETKPSDDDINNYKVAPDMPRVLSIEKLGVKSRIFSMGQDSKGALIAPGNIHDTGWYNQSSKPGQAGAVLLDGHVHGPTQEGVFYKLKNLSVGDKIEVERGDGQKFTYEVVTSAVTPVDKTDMAKAMLPIKPGEQGLNLITCTGKFNAESNDYPERLVIYASRV
jgi:LPXTG-site transpeptidase (sortase) family protein